MARSSVLRSLLLRNNLLAIGRSSPSIFRSSETLISSSSSSSTAIPAKFFTTTTTTAFTKSRNTLAPLGIRNFCSGPSNIVMIKSDEEFNSSLAKVQDESIPAVFYFTASWCGPCRFLAPIISKWSEIYPHVTTYKIDIDETALHSTLLKLNINSVPTLHFYNKGKKESEVIGADLESLKATMERLYT